MKADQRVDAPSFFRQHSVFTVGEFTQFLAERSGVAEVKEVSDEARQTLLRYHEKTGRILRVRRGLYASVSAGENVSTYEPDMYLVASRLAGDAVLAHHTALALHGAVDTDSGERLILSAHRSLRALNFGGVTCRFLLPPLALPKSEALTLGVEIMDRQGIRLKITSLERAFVDMLDRPVLSGGWGAVCESLNTLEARPLDWELLKRYVVTLREASIAAKVGYYLETQQERLRVPETLLHSMHTLAPKHPIYVERRQRTGARFIARWNLLVPNV